jgi:hypothetical protein
MAIVLIACAPLYLSTKKLTWFDTRLNYKYDIEVTTAEGRKYEVGRLFFSPYNLQFTQNRFWFLEKRPLATRTFGSVTYAEDLALIEELLDSAKPEELDERILAVENRIGKSHYDLEERERLRNFLHVFFTNVNKRGEWGRVIPMFSAPDHIISYPSVDEPFAFQDVIESFQVWGSVWYIRERPIQVRRELLMDDTL